ncbi:MAG: 4-(cytidine 5'-diphospho)-2-C-methyl-D-erythritol kinase [Armatimonadota bacterium]|nr:4-(cytidine 5'-diphospho)-2-C-methyl-D-erythritol kinase [Armatimonadota bacterium]MDR7447663.1 4-(cytidine 5'-diphospho)-2-C-methyl-D-erythritol kinase [Armatimonadota bacterium]MDR7458997.1 4-(cytidine 5'-diphospho)-2-C-methyl-D-erythritol kinase [Armatimonadota bacterium]MDR7480099.1 4-(cytidine 5'-diphospho)-2-C-methyl-D-erythritol kinase [Armatimonadota bacterium]MDR7489552.1 4-(cytidine 5'-diphospho)-2-C-methyl-D-erythritol kinase [Armatimonadota bacterium]
MRAAARPAAPRRSLRGRRPAAQPTLVVRARAKINLALDVLGRRPDGYHDVATVLHTIALHDTLMLRPHRSAIQLALAPGAAASGVPLSERNLVVQAAQRLRERFAVRAGARITLHKAIPVAAGLGGGSADAAGALVGLARLWRLRADAATLHALAAALGADVPFLLRGGAALGRGRGDRLEPLPALPPLPVVLARPPVAISTAWAYAALDRARGAHPGAAREREHRVQRVPRPDVAAAARALAAGDLRALGKAAGNVFSAVVERRHPIVRDLAAVLRRHGAVVAGLSGSGPVVYGVLEDARRARAAAAALRRLPGVEVWLTRLSARGVTVERRRPQGPRW